MSLCCQQEERRDVVRQRQGWNGLDYVEVSEDQRTLYAYFLGKLPPELSQEQPGLARYLRLEGGRRSTDIGITKVEPVADPDPEVDDFLVIGLDRFGDFSTYTLRLVGVANVDPRYDHAEFSFKVNCPSDLDCAPACTCDPIVPAEPEINYLAKDYASFRQLLFDRLALLMPNWQERHAPDLGVALVELLAYTGDYLSYYQDAVATEAYLDTARQRISVRRHVRLVDYLLHEGCNARTWVYLEVSSDMHLDPTDVSFITGLNDMLTARQTILTWEDLRGVPRQTYEVFEPCVADRTTTIQLLTAHNEIHFYTFGDKECCLERGSTAVALVDSALHLQPGDILLFEEVRGAVTGLAADADPTRRHAVRLTSVTAKTDPIILQPDGSPTPYVDITWAVADALPFPLCISAIGAAPDCRYLDNISVARGNMILVDHGQTQPPEDLGHVPTLGTQATCECADHPSLMQYIPGRFCPSLSKTPLTYRASLPTGATPAAGFLWQDVRTALPQVGLTTQPVEAWTPRLDLVDSRPIDRHFVVEVDNDGLAHVRFGDGELGYQPPAGMRFTATYRIGNGSAGNVGAESISRLVLGKTTVSGVSVSVRNPLPAVGGTEPEPLAEAKLFAPHQFRKRLERAIVADDYSEIAERDPKIQRASAALTWTGSWYEADVALDPLGSEADDAALLAEMSTRLEPYRRMGHDLSVRPAVYVPIDLRLDVCVLPHYRRADVKRALLDVFSNRVLPKGRLGFFHPNNLTFGEGIFLSKIVALAQAVPGVECTQVTRLQRLFEPPNHEIENGVLPLRSWEIAQLDNDPNYPEHGKLDIQVRGGR